MRNSNWTILLFTVFVYQFAFSQDARFSQIWSAPIQFNSSLTGRFDGKVKLATLFSNQKSNAQNIGPTAVQHQNISLEFKLGKYKSNGDEKNNPDTIQTKNAKDYLDVYGYKRHGYWAGAVNYYHYGDDQSAIDGKFYSLSLARHSYFMSNKYFGIGGQFTYAEGDLNEKRGSLFNYDKEINGGGFRYPFLRNRNPNSTPLRSTKRYTDFNVGAYYGLLTESVMFELGFAMNHLFYPKVSLTPEDQEAKLRHRISAHSLLRVKLNEKTGLIQRNMYWQEGLYLRSRVLNGDSVEKVAFWSGVEFYRINPMHKLNINYGLYMRSFRTVMPYLNINTGNFINFRYSYELPINSSKFNAYSAKRSEIAMILTLERNTSPGTKFYRKFNFW